MPGIAARTIGADLEVLAMGGTRITRGRNDPENRILIDLTGTRRENSEEKIGKP
jgi:hypothetical protein